MRSIAVINQKGGVGKTTTTVNLGAGLARRGYRVLLLDMDPQANLTVHVDKRPDLESGTLTSLMLEDENLADIIQTTAQHGLFVVPASSRFWPTASVARRSFGRRSRALRRRSAATRSTWCCSTALLRLACFPPTPWSRHSSS